MKDKSERENLLIFISSFIIGIPLAFIIALAAESYTNKPYKLNPIEIIQVEELYEEERNNNVTTQKDNSIEFINKDISNKIIDSQFQLAETDTTMQSFVIISKNKENDKYYLFVKETKEGTISKIETTKEQYNSFVLVDKGGNY